MLIQLRAYALDIILLITRLYVANVFIKSGLQKLSDPDTTHFLFDQVYHVPFLPASIAAPMATWSEIIFGIMVLVGALTAFASLALFAVNVVAVYAYSSELLKGGIGLSHAGDWISGVSLPAGFEQHLGWGIMLLFLASVGGGKISLDGIFDHRNVRFGFI